MHTEETFYYRTPIVQFQRRVSRHRNHRAHRGTYNSKGSNQIAKVMRAHLPSAVAEKFHEIFRWLDCFRVLIREFLTQVHAVMNVIRANIPVIVERRISFLFRELLKNETSRGIKTLLKPLCTVIL